MVDGKVCSKCKVWKPAEDFRLRPSRPSGITSRCTICLNEDARIYAQANAEKVNQKQREDYAANIEESRAYGRAKMKQYREEGKVAEYRKRYRAENSEKVRAQDKQVYEKHREKINKRQRQYAKDNAEARAEYFKNWAKTDAGRASIKASAERHKPKARATVGAYRARNLAKLSAYYLEWKKTPHGKHICNRAKHRRREMEQANPATLTLAEWQQIISEQNGECACCHRTFTASLFPTRDHILPVTKGGALSKENVQALCRSCNSRKGTRIIDYRRLASHNSL